MERALAERLMAASLALDAGLGAVDDLISGVDDKELRIVLVRRLGAVIQSVDQELIRPIAIEFPDLDPTNGR